MSERRAMARNPHTIAANGIAATEEAEAATQCCLGAKEDPVTETTLTRLRGDEISVSAKQAARLIGLPLRTLQADTKAGKIPAARRIGRRYIYMIEELKRMVENAARPEMS